MNALAMKARPLGHPIGYHAIHPDVSLNFQMNRWFSWVGDVGMLDEMRTVAPRITTYADWQREFAALAQQALANVRNPAQNLKAAYYFGPPSSSFRLTTHSASPCASNSCD